MKNNNSLRWFTLIEIVFVVVLIAVWLMSIITAMDYGLKNVWIARQRVIAINLAREWIESVYQIRDTNRLSWSSQKDECWLKINPLSDDDCNQDSWMQSGYYALNTFVSWGQQFFYLTWWDWTPLDLSDWINTGDMKYSMCENDWTWLACTGTSYDWQTRYFRQIQGLWLFLKNSDTVGWDYIDCEKWAETAFNCSGNDAKEFRFCSKVSYIGETNWDIELCGLMTNFKD